MPRVSIALPAWNAADTLPSCLASIARQTLQDWECVIVDDGSTDRTGAIALDAAERDSRFRVVSLPHGGVVAALNEGLRHCRAALVARMDADDLMHRERLSAQVDALDRDGRLSAVGCHVRLFPRTPMSPRLREYESWLNSLRSPEDVSRDAFVESPVVHPSLMMRRDMAALAYHDCSWPEDYDLILRALASGLRIGVVPRRLLSWRDVSGSLSRTDDRYHLDEFTRCKAHYLAAGFLAGSERYILWGYGRTGRNLQRALAALGKTPSHIVEVKQTRIGNRIHGAPVIGPDAVPAIADHPIVVSVARTGPRAVVRATLSSLRLVEGRHYVCAA